VQTPDRSKEIHREAKPTKFGEAVTADHFIAKDEDLSPDGYGPPAGLVIYDLGTAWLECYPVDSKKSHECFHCYNDFVSPKETVQSFYCDNAGELLTAANDIGWKLGTSTPGRSETNGVAETKVKKVVRGTTTILDHAGFTPDWWPVAVRHFCFTNNFSAKGDSPYNKRFDKNFHGMSIPFGALVDFRRSNTRDPVGKFTPKAVAGIFLGYHLQPGGKWSGDYIVVELQELKAQRHYKHASIQRVKEAAKPCEFAFPLKKGYEANRNTLEGFDLGTEVTDHGSCPAPVKDGAETEEREDVALASSVGGLTTRPNQHPKEG
jgi:hypothetical protein